MTTPAFLPLMSGLAVIGAIMPFDKARAMAMLPACCIGFQNALGALVPP